MARYRWTIEFDAEDDADAAGQIDTAVDAFRDYDNEDLEQLEEGSQKPHIGGGPKPKRERREG